MHGVQLEGVALDVVTVGEYEARTKSSSSAWHARTLLLACFAMTCTTFVATLRSNNAAPPALERRRLADSARANVAMLAEANAMLADALSVASYRLLDTAEYGSSDGAPIMKLADQTSDKANPITKCSSVIHTSWFSQSMCWETRSSKYKGQNCEWHAGQCREPKQRQAPGGG